jgi:hypothetical protein
MPDLPDVPTVADTVAGYEASQWYGFAAPKNTPAEIVDKLNKEINAAIADPGMKASLPHRRRPDAGLRGRFRQTDRRRNREMGQGGRAAASSRSEAAPPRSWASAPS